MISWRDAQKLTLKRNRRKRVFGGLKYGAPLFSIILLTIVTLNVFYVVQERVQNKMEDREYPHKSHLIVKTPGDDKTQKPMTQSQIRALKNHPATQEMMTHVGYFYNHYADMGEVRYSSNTTLAGYTNGLFNLYRILPQEKSDPACIPALLGRDLLSLSWSPDLKSFIRNEKEEMRRWLGRTITVYINPLGTEFFENNFKLNHLDYQRHRTEIINNRRQKLDELNRTRPDIARRQDAVFIKLQVVGFIRDQLDSGTTTVIPTDTCNQILEISDLSRDKKRIPQSEDKIYYAQLLAKPGMEKDLADFVRSVGLEVKDKDGTGVVAKLFKEIKNNHETRLGIFMMASIYFLTVMTIIYQLLGGQVKDAVREIGLLRCIGARRMDIMRIFMMMNLLRLARIYLFCIVSAYLLLLGAGFWSASKLNLIDPEYLAKGSIPEFLISRIDNFSPFWLMGPSWMAFAPLLILFPIALCAAAVPIWHAMGVQPSEALKD